MTKTALMNTPESPFARIYKLVVVGPSIFSRIFWFILGGPLSLGLNSTIFFTAQWLRLSDPVALGISLTTTTVVFSVWNYFINFRSSSNFAECLPRYLAALGCCFAVNYAISLTGFKQFAHDDKLLKFAVMAASTIIVSGVKFLLYHFWVYPHTPPSKDPVGSVQG